MATIFNGITGHQHHHNLPYVLRLEADHKLSSKAKKGNRFKILRPIKNPRGYPPTSFHAPRWGAYVRELGLIRFLLSRKMHRNGAEDRICQGIDK